jgi:protein-S-isoprenylcysteine O-methyltransferase Ste14
MFLQGMILANKKLNRPDKNMRLPVIGALIIIARILTNNMKIALYATISVKIGGLINLFALINIGKNFSARVKPNIDHFLVSNGIYKFIRHPRYLGLLLLHFGLAVSINHFLALGGVLICMIGFLYRIAVEEKYLAELYGQNWANYVQKSWKLIPFIF